MREASSKNYGVAVCLSGIFGILGIHHFYLGCWIHGLVDLTLTVSGFAFVFSDRPILGWTILAVDWLHTIIVTIILLVGAYKDGSGRIVTYPGQELT
jgi:TM2 domain-containing membrane protein YozV